MLYEKVVGQMDLGITLKEVAESPQWPRASDQGAAAPLTPHDAAVARTERPGGATEGELG